MSRRVTRRPPSQPLPAAVPFQFDAKGSAELEAFLKRVGTEDVPVAINLVRVAIEGALYMRLLPDDLPARDLLQRLNETKQHAEALAGLLRHEREVVGVLREAAGYTAGGVPGDLLELADSLDQVAALAVNSRLFVGRRGARLKRDGTRNLADTLVARCTTVGRTKRAIPIAPSSAAGAQFVQLLGIALRASRDPAWLVKDPREVARACLKRGKEKRR